MVYLEQIVFYKNVTPGMFHNFLVINYNCYLIKAYVRNNRIEKSCNFSFIFSYYVGNSCEEIRDKIKLISLINKL